MVHAFTHAGDRWRAETTGGSYTADGRTSLGVDFVHEPTDRRIPGRLNPVDAKQPTDARLTEALEAALATLRAKVPHVSFEKADNGAEGFAILHQMYTGFTRDPANTTPGYFGTDFQVIIDEATARRDLALFFGLSAAAIDDLIAKARRRDGM